MVAAGKRKGPALGVIALATVVALGVSLAREAPSSASRDEGLAAALGGRGLVVDRKGIVWLGNPSRGVWRSATSTVVAAVRARPAPEDPHDIFLVTARLSPEGALLDVGRHHHLTETSAVDELAPVSDGSGRFAFVERPTSAEEAPRIVRLVDLGRAPERSGDGWTRLERLQAAITRLQQSGRADGISQVAYELSSAPSRLDIALADGQLVIDAGEQRAVIALDRPLDAPSWLTVEAETEPRPGNLVTWAVDRVRGEIGDEAMQYVKAIAFSVLDQVLSRTEDLTGDSAAEDIAADLGEESLASVPHEIPVDPDIGFPPPALEPIVTPALEGEGQWQAKADEAFVHSLPGLPPTFVSTFIRGDPMRKVTRVYVLLWDPRLLELHTMAGTAEPKSATGATGPGLIPREPTVLRRLAAAMNAGFQALHGEFGMMSDGVIYLPPKPYGATVATLHDGSTAFGTWPNDATIPPDMLSYRQNMTPIVVDEQFNPYKRTWWGGTPSDWEDKTHTVRTGICITKESFVGYFYGADLSPEALGRAMIAARCSYGIALDMNAGHSGLEFYRAAPSDELPPLDRPMREWEREGAVGGLDGWKFRARRLISGMGLMNFPRYINREGRDFFYLTLRYVLPGAPIEAKAEGDGAWRVKGLPQHGFPYALAQTELALGGARVRVLKIDPRMLTADAAAATPSKEGQPAVVAAVAPSPTADGGRALWLTPGAFAIGVEPPLPAAMRVCTEKAGLERAAAALGVEDVGGMLLYVEVVDGDLPAKELQAFLSRLGSSESLFFEEPSRFALGGSMTLAGGTAPPPEAGAVLLYRHAGPGGRRIFGGTPVVPFKDWYPLQARRIRYFKKKDG
jgi:hypothetical protein